MSLNLAGSISSGILYRSQNFIREVALGLRWVISESMRTIDSGKEYVQAGIYLCLRTWRGIEASWALRQGMRCVRLACDVGKKKKKAPSLCHEATPLVDSMRLREVGYI